MIGMNALIDLEYAAGTISVECTGEQSMYSVQTAFKIQIVLKKMKLICTNSFLNILCTYDVRTLYEQCTYNVHTLYVQNMVKVHTMYISVQNYAFCTYTVCTLDFGHRSICTGMYRLVLTIASMTKYIQCSS
jgi:hypothetical protein